tara:strand:- start:4 stop:633 length:630 start_codon:yes stop_codon:yes gene_type:complete
MSLPEGTPLKGAAIKAVKRFEATLISLVVGNNAVNIGGGMFLGGWAVGELGSEGAQAFSVVFTVAVMVFGEIIPKALGAAQSLRVVRATSPALLALNWVLTPVIAVLGCLTKWLPQSPTPKEERELISAARLLDETPVSEMMGLNPRVHNRASDFYPTIQSDVTGDVAIKTLKLSPMSEGIAVVSYENTQVVIGHLSERDALGWLFDHY